MASTPVAIKRSQIKHFLNTGTVETPEWSVIGKGITTGAIEYNPSTVEETYIDEDSGTTMIEGYKPTMPIEGTGMAGDPAFDYLDNLRIERAVLGGAQGEVVNVWLYKTEVTGSWPAERQAVNISWANFGGEGGKKASFSATLNYVGDPVPGTFNPTTKTFTPTP
jgi:hypothetical protein